MSATFTNDWISYVNKLLYRGVGTLPAANKFRLCASESATLTRASSLADFIKAELKPEFGYNRASVVWAENGAYSNVNQRHELPTTTARWTADGATLQFRTVFLLANAHSKAAEVFTPANVSGSVINIAGNVLSNGDTVIPIANPGSTLPGNLVSGDAYTVLNVNGGNFHFSSDGINPIVLSNTGSGSFQLRYATGSVVLLQVEPLVISLQPGQPLEYDIDLAGLSTAYGGT